MIIHMIRSICVINFHQLAGQDSPPLNGRTHGVRIMGNRELKINISKSEEAREDENRFYYFLHRPSAQHVYFPMILFSSSHYLLKMNI